MKTILGMVLVLLLAACNQGDLEQRLRSEGRAKLNEVCLSKAGSAPLSKLLDAAQYQTFCGCFADRGIASVGIDELKSLATGTIPSGLQDRVTEQAKDCARPMIDADFKGIIKNQCIQAAQAQGQSDQTVRDFCACSATKALEQLGPDGRKRILDALDIGAADMETVKSAAASCAQSTLQ